MNEATLTSQRATVHELLAVREDCPEEIFSALKTVFLSEREYAAYSSHETHSDSAARAFVDALRATGRVIVMSDGGDIFRLYR